MRFLRQAFAVAFVVFAFCAAAVAEDAPAKDKELERWIEQLAEISKEGFGYSAYFAGGEFLPYKDTGEMNVLVIGKSRATRSDTMRKIVEKGADAVPSLVKHLDDARTIKMEPVRAMMWMEFADEYDYNRRTRKQKPEGVNRRSHEARKADQPTEYAVTVGDLCFVALGQIVNRNFSVTRYQPTGGVIVSSPTYSAALRKVIRDDWTGLTREQHKNMLIDDFVNPDYERRRIGAYWRLAFYYPESVEPLVLKHLAEPCYDAFEVNRFVRKKIYRAKDAEERKNLLEAFVAKHGEVARQAVHLELFQDLCTLEANEQGRISPRLKEKYGARECLVELYGHPKDIKSRNCPRLFPMEHCVQARFIESLTHDTSRKIGDAVQKLLLEFPEDQYFASACLKCLANRGYAPFLIEQLNKIDPAAAKENPLHAACIEAICSSKDPAVRDKLAAVIQTTSNEAYFWAALPAMDRSRDELVWKSAVAMLDKLPPDADRGLELLKMIGQRFPDRAQAVYLKFMAPGTVQRAEVLCNVLSNGNPMAIEVLAPLLDDKRPLTGYPLPMRVCDRAAEAMSEAEKAISFDSRYGEASRDKQIEAIKEYCKKKAKQKPASPYAH
jgi:hypothetical protein